jgi:site-specific recombinase XerD
MISLGRRSATTALVPIEATPTRLEQAIHNFLLDRHIAGATPKTLSTYADQFRPFMRWCLAHGLDLDGLGVEALRRYLAHRRERSTNALFDAVRRLKAFFRWCAQEQLCSDIAASIRPPRLQTKVIEAFTEPQVRALLALCSEPTLIGRRDEALIRLMLDSGVRISEALALTALDVDLINSRVHIRNGKGQRARYAPIGAKTARALMRYLAVRETASAISTNIFITKEGEPLNRRHAEQHIARLGKRAGIEGVRVSPHTFRHTCAIWFLRRGGDAFSLQALLGHSSLAMTKRYVAMRERDVSDAHARFGPGELV